jgi:hypothetical protein
MRLGLAENWFQLIGDNRKSIGLVYFLGFVEGFRDLISRNSKFKSGNWL